MTDPWASRSQPADPYQLQPVQPRRRPSRRTAVVGLIVLAVLGAGIGYWVAGIGKPEHKTSPPAVDASQSSSLTPREACRQAIVLTNDAVSIMSAFVGKPDGSTVDRAKLQDTIKGLAAVEPNMPDRLGENVREIRTPLLDLADALDAGGNQAIDLRKFRSDGPGLIIACGSYIQG